MYLPQPPHTRVFLLALLLVASCAGRASARQAPPETYRISYRLAMPAPAAHLFDVRVEVETPGPAEAVDFQLPRWSPGRYAVFDFAVNVQEVRAQSACPPAETCESVTLPVTRLDTQTWRVRTGGAGPNAAGPFKRFLVSYKVFADDLSGTFSQLDARHANFNGATLFMYVVGHKQDPVSLIVEPPRGWKIVNGYPQAAADREWRFPNYDVLIDTPTEIAPDWSVDEFRVGGKTYRVVVHSFGDEKGRRKELVRRVERVVRAEVAMWGEPDFASYTFLFHFDPTARRGDGMEHLTSTQIVLPRSLGNEGALEDAVDTAAHEFFHVWNVKRLRPAELGPWDFTRPLATRSLWIAEGLTNYYGHLSQRRAGVWTDEDLYRALAAQIAAVENAPGSRLMSAEEASLVAPFLDRSVFAQRTNLRQTAVSYYDKGEVVGLVLDLLLRGRTGGRASVDDVLRRAYEEFYLKSPNASYYLRGRGYTPEDFRRVASEAAGADLSDFFARHVGGTEPPPYDEALAHVGLRLTKTPAKPTRGGPDDAVDANRPGAARFDYRIEELPNATAQARALRRGWLKRYDER